MRSNLNRTQDLQLRAVGLLSIGVAVVALRHLNGLVNAPPHHEASVIEMLLAAIGFLGMTAGSAVAILGDHLFDEVEITRPWGHASNLMPMLDSPPVAHRPREPRSPDGIDGNAGPQAARCSAR